MGVDCYGLNPVMKEGSGEPKEPKDFGTLTEKDQRAYWDAVDKYRQENKGVYFRNNWWFWRPMWDFVNEKCNDLIDQELYDKGHGNDGDVDQELAIDISKRILTKEVLDEAKRKQEEYDKDAKPKQEFNELLSKAGKLYFDEIIKPMYPDKKNLVPADLETLDKDAYKKWEALIFDLQYRETSYPFSWENVKEFGEFCAQSGGFEIR
jgi:hypothetical protein